MTDEQKIAYIFSYLNDIPGFTEQQAKAYAADLGIDLATLAGEMSLRRPCKVGPKPLD